MEDLLYTIIGANLGAQKLAHSLFARVWCPKLRATVCMPQFIAACQTCKWVKDSTSLRAGLQHSLPILNSHFTSCSMDSTTKFLLSQGSNTFFFVFVFCLSKFTKLISYFMWDNTLTAG